MYKVCPRCGEKNFKNAKVCINCRLIFARLEYASNQKAKEAIIKGEKEKIIKTTILPKDLCKWKLLLMCAFGGLLGIHNLKIGRYFKGFFSLFFTTLTIILLTVLNGNIISDIYHSILFLPAGIVFFFWFYDLFLIVIGKYKVPIALDIPEKAEVVSVKE